MADVISLTGTQVRVTATGMQSLQYALDVGWYDEFYLETYVASLEGTLSSPQVEIAVWTGMQLETEDGWVSVYNHSFDAVGFHQTRVGPGTFLRYLRWKVQTYSGITGGAATFWIAGVGRRLG